MYEYPQHQFKEQSCVSLSFIKLYDEGYNMILRYHKIASSYDRGSSGTFSLSAQPIGRELALGLETQLASLG